MRLATLLLSGCSVRVAAALMLLCTLAAGLVHAPMASALTCTSVGSGNWSAAGTWTSAGNCNRVPVAGDDVVIGAGTTTLDANSAALASLTVNGTLTIGNNGTGRSLSVTGNIAVGGSGTISVGATAATHTLAAGGDVVNDGVINLAPAANRVCNVTFNKNGSQTVSGAGAYTFNLIAVNEGASSANVLDMQAAITVPSPFLTITNGTYKHSSPSNITPWTTGAGATIPANGGFWLNSAATVTTSVDVTVNGGYLRISGGAMNVGSADGTRVMLGNFASTLLWMEGGVLTVTGGINSSSGTAAGTFTMTGGTMNLQTIDAGPQYTLLLGTATTLNWSGGLIVAAKGNNTTDDVDIRSAAQNVTGGTLQMGSGASSGNQISLINGAGGSVTLWNLELSQSSANAILMRSSTNVLNDLTIDSLNTLAPNAGLAINVGGGNGAGGGNWINNGAFTQSTTVVSFVGTAASTIGGTTATTFYGLAINKTAAALASRKVTLARNATISNQLTLTNGFVDSATFSVIIPAGGSVTRGAGCSADGSVNGCFVSGNLQKNFAASGAAQTRSYEVGSATASLVAYAPVSITLATVTTAGNLVVATTAGDNPALGSSALDGSKSANRYWTIANAGTVFTALAGNAITFNFVAADLDPGATPLNFNYGRYSGSWTVSPPPTPTRTATSTSIAGTTITTAALPGQYAVAETGVTFGTPGSFNTFETSTAPNAISGVIKTKVAGAAFGLDVVAISAGAQMSSFGANVKVELLANSGGGYGADNCPLAGSVVETIASAAIAGGRSTVSFAAVADAYRDVRVRVSYPAVAPTSASCSTDSFAIRPNALVNLAVTDNDAQTPGTARALSNVTFGGGAPVHKAGRTFTVRGDAVNGAASPAVTANYTGAPAVVVWACGASAPCTSSFGGLTFNTVFAAGHLDTSAASYDQVGSFTLQLVDTSFASIDAADGSTLAERTVQSSPINVGRFVPDHFAVALDTPMFQTACSAGGFTYVGQKFGYSVVPIITVTAQDASNNPTTFYTGSWWRITSATLTGKTYAALTGSLDASGTPVSDPAIAESGAGVGTLTFDSGTGLDFDRTGVVAPFAANVSLSIDVIDADGVAATANPVVFGAGAGIQFSTGSAIRYGRVRLSTAVGSELVDLPLAMVAEYYAGAGSGFVVNTDDTCTGGVSLALSAYTKNLAAGETCVRDSGSPGASGIGCAPAAPLVERYQGPPSTGDFNLTLAAPGAGNNGSVQITAAVPTWLRYDWNAATPGDENPSGEATFGVFGGQSKQIYSREIY